MIGILLLTHSNIGDALLETATDIVGPNHVPVDIFKVNHDLDLSDLTTKVTTAIKSLERGDGVLILTDLYGATPYNVAKDIGDFNTAIVSGLNLNMLLSVLNYAESLPLDQLVSKAEGAGHIGIHSDAKG